MFKDLKKIGYILTSSDKKKLLGIFGLIIVNAFFDFVSISTILPLVSLLTDGAKAIESNFILQFASNILHTKEVQPIFIFTIILLLSFFVLKTIFLFIYTFVSSKFTLNYSRRLTKKLMDVYLNYPYEFHLNHNSSELINKSTYDVTCFSTSIDCLLRLCVAFITALIIIIYLFVANWITALIVGGLLGAFSVFVVLVLRPHTKKVSAHIQRLNNDNYKYLSQAFNGIKESKISNSEQYFVDIYDKNRIQINKSTLRNTIYSSLPSQTIEFVGMFALCISLLTIFLIGEKGSDIIATFAVFVYAVIKLLPAVIHITTYLNNLVFYKTSINILYNDLKDAELNSENKNNEPVIPLNFEKEISIENVGFYYDSIPDKIVLENICLKIQKNSSVAFCGASGAGKTTMIDLILGLLPCRKGKITCDGVDINDNMRGWRTNISYIPQTIYLSDDTIRNNVAFGIERKDVSDEKIWEALEKAQLKEYVEKLPSGLDTIIGERGIRMSGGQRQRIGIARAFYRNTNIIVFDEATSALDYETERNILDHVSQYSDNHTLIIITHRLNTIDSCDQIYKVEDKKVHQIK